MIDVSALAKTYREEIRSEIKDKIKLVGFICEKEGPSRTYAKYINSGCKDVGISFELRDTSKHQLEKAILAANVDPSISGIICFYPIFETGQDAYIRNLVDPLKDVEGLHNYWLQALYANKRELYGNKAIVPSTPLAIVKLLNEMKIQMDKTTVAIFNRSEVVGRPLAAMLANDGALVYSFDAQNLVVYQKDSIQDVEIPRLAALLNSDVVITGVPSPSFPPIQLNELRGNAICLNFSTIKNFADDVESNHVFVPRIGPITVAMLLRNSLRLLSHQTRKYAHENSLAW